MQWHPIALTQRTPYKAADETKHTNFFVGVDGLYTCFRQHIRFQDEPVPAATDEVAVVQILAVLQVFVESVVGIIDSSGTAAAAA